MIFLLFTVILVPLAAAEKCGPPPYRSDMSVIYGSGFVEYTCNHQNVDRTYVLRCTDGMWHGSVPKTCGNDVRPTVLPTRRPTPLPPTVAPRPWPVVSKCGASPYREDMLSYEGPEGLFVDYYCKPPPGGYYQSFAYRLVCRFNRWMGDLPDKCPQGLYNYPRHL